MERHRWIVVGTDFSPAATRALRRAAELAGALGASVACVHAYEDRPGPWLQSDATPDVVPRLDDVAARIRARFPNVPVECFVHCGTPWEALRDVACELAADMIVVGASGEHGRANPGFVGRVVARVTVASDRSILVVPNPDAALFASA